MGTEIAFFLPWLAALLRSHELRPRWVDILIDNTYHADRHDRSKRGKRVLNLIPLGGGGYGR